MTGKERKILKEKIQEELGKISHEIRELEKVTRPISPDNAIGRVSRMDAIGNKMVNEQVLNNARERQFQLQTVFERTDDAEFGMCISCAQSIAVNRLRAIPESKLCIHCASRR